jgi:hypothetical protein
MRLGPCLQAAPYSAFQRNCPKFGEPTKGLFVWKAGLFRLARQPGKRDKFILRLYEKCHPACRDDFSRHFSNKQYGVTETYYCAISTLPAMMMQFSGAILLWKIHLKQQKDAICMLLLRKQSYWRQKWEKTRQRYLQRKKHSCWHKPEQTDLWWENILTGVSPEESWKKNFRMSRDDFMELEAELRPTHHLNLDHQTTDVSLLRRN